MVPAASSPNTPEAGEVSERSDGEQSVNASEPIAPLLHNACQYYCRMLTE